MSNKSRFHPSLIYSKKSREDLWLHIYHNTFSAKNLLKYLITDRTQLVNTQLPENCVINPEQVIDFVRVLISNAPEDIQDEIITKFRKDLDKVFDKYCQKGKLRRITINGTLYYEP